MENYLTTQGTSLSNQCMNSFTKTDRKSPTHPTQGITLPGRHMTKDTTYGQTWNLFTHDIK